MANNHIMDYGKEGIGDVTDVFKNHNISHFGVGTDDYNVLIQELKGISFAFIGFVKNGRWSRKQPGDFGPDSYDIEKLTAKVKSLKEWVDHIIIFPHFGTELVDIPDPEDVKNSRLLIEAGASAVIGHHPHIIQGIENYKHGIIAYSLGSFIYIPENEAGYHSGQNSNRDFSICLNLSFDQTKITEVKTFYYTYNKTLKIPVEFRENIPYFNYVNQSIDNTQEYHSKIRKILLKRELISFYERFKNAPLSTFKHYFKYLKISHLKKLFS
jgi:poly-gamma-glutamate synthesis protein (capsule biosynthesis protein)